MQRLLSSAEIVKVKFFPSLKGPYCGADLRFLSCSPQPDTSRSCKTTVWG